MAMLTGMTATETTPAALIQAGFQAQNGGDMGAAEAAYREALRQQPEHPVALQLLGLLLRRRGEVAAAEALFRRSLRAQPAQPHVWNNLGNLLHAGARSSDALAAFDQALALDADCIDAHYNRARVLHGLARLDEAAASLNRALAMSAQPTVPMLQLHAQIEADGGHLESALRTLGHALQAAPDKPTLLHNQAVLLQRLHRHAQALE
ncbi:MAG: tetratricopeptide repeat protein, partial [Chitinophagaceae bacterium]|nr:tetratricopeptide repeat protein [Rubrivivax sp.]